jgi:dihydrolipoamide dehydrogenase
VIGCEFAFIYRSLGCEVTIVELMPHALSTEDHELSEIIEREMKKAKIKLITNGKVEKTEKTGHGVITRLSQGQEITTDQILVSIGRSMNSANIGLDAAGVNTGKRGEIIVNKKMETNIPGVYAIGDVTGNIMLAHVASRQGIVAVENALGGDSSMDYSAIPSAIFTAPEIGSVGLREKQAAEQGLKYRVGRFQFRALGKAHAIGEISGMVKILADAGSDKILGVHICGPRATDLIQEGVLAIKSGATAAQLGDLIHAHPTLSESVMEAAEDVHGRSIHIPRPQK